MSRILRLLMATVPALAVTLALPGQATAASAERVTTGIAHTCAITTAGDVRCWGDNFEGQLGGQAWPVARIPVEVSGLPEMMSVDAGDAHTCGVTATGAVKCWGDNWAGQLGNGSTEDQTAPVDVVGLSAGVVDVTAGGAHSCALLETGSVMCWGWNPWGALGDGSTTSSAVPVEVDGLSNVVQVDTGGTHSCAVDRVGAAFCWGRNMNGQIGDATGVDRLTPVGVNGHDGDVLSLSAGAAHTCAVSEGGAVTCWGWNFDGQLGDSTRTTRLAPVPVAGLAQGVTQASAGLWHTCARTSAGAALCWGANRSKQIGDRTARTRTTPTRVLGLQAGVLQVHAGGAHTCARVGGGSVRCWGDNEDGQIGDNSSFSLRPMPMFVRGFGGVETSVRVRSLTPVARVGDLVTLVARVRPALDRGSMVFGEGSRRNLLPILGCRHRPVRNGIARCTLRFETSGRRHIRAFFRGTTRFNASDDSPSIIQAVRHSLPRR